MQDQRECKIKKHNFLRGEGLGTVRARLEGIRMKNIENMSRRLQKQDKHNICIFHSNAFSQIKARNLFIGKIFDFTNPEQYVVFLTNSSVGTRKTHEKCCVVFEIFLKGMFFLSRLKILSSKFLYP